MNNRRKTIVALARARSYHRSFPSPKAGQSLRIVSSCTHVHFVYTDYTTVVRQECWSGYLTENLTIEWRSARHSEKLQALAGELSSLKLTLS